MGRHPYGVAHGWPLCGPPQPGGSSWPTRFALSTTHTCFSASGVSPPPASPRTPVCDPFHRFLRHEAMQKIDLNKESPPKLGIKLQKTLLQIPASRWGEAASMLPWAQLIVGLFLGKVMGEMCTAWCRHRASRCLQDRLFQGVPRGVIRWTPRTHTPATPHASGHTFFAHLWAHGFSPRTFVRGPPPMKYLCLRCFVWEGIHPLPHKKNAIVAHQTPWHSPRLLHKPPPPLGAIRQRALLLGGGGPASRQLRPAANNRPPNVPRQLFRTSHRFCLKNPADFPTTVFLSLSFIEAFVCGGKQCYK